MNPTVLALDAWVLRAPIETPVANAFAAMTNRPAVWIRLLSEDGFFGWGESFSNFPPIGAEHRARLATSVFRALVVGADSTDPQGVRAMLARRTRLMALQCGEPGPFAQVAGAIDQALWDLKARRAGVPLWKLLGGRPRVRPYASGIGPDGVVETMLAKAEEGYRAFKLKVGFGPQRDVANLAAARRALGDDVEIMCDANQAWTPEEAVDRIGELAPMRPLWIEEPIAADQPLGAWRRVAERGRVPLAAGENIRGEEEFEAILRSGVLHYVQPDVGKWGGVGGGLQVAALARDVGVAYCPHWLAGGVGLAASMHALAAAGEPQGWAEVDANPNPLREQVFPFSVEDGWVTLDDRPGLGFVPDLDALAGMLVRV